MSKSIKKIFIILFIFTVTFLISVLLNSFSPASVHVFAEEASEEQTEASLEDDAGALTDEGEDEGTEEEEGESGFDVAAITDELIAWLQEHYGAEYEEIYNTLMSQYDSSIKEYIESLVEQQKITEEEAAGWEVFSKTAIGVLAGAILVAVIITAILLKRKANAVVAQFKTAMNQLLVGESALTKNGQATNAALKKILSVKGKEEADGLSKSDEALKEAREEIEKDV